MQYGLVLKEDKSLCSAESHSRTIDSYKKIGTLLFLVPVLTLKFSPVLASLFFGSVFWLGLVLVVFIFLMLELQYYLACIFLHVLSRNSVIVFLPFGYSNPIDCHQPVGFVYFT